MKSSIRRGVVLALVTLFCLSIALPAAAGSSKSRAKRANRAGAVALNALSATARTLAGPGLFVSDDNGAGLVYEVVSGTGPDICITLTNAGRSDIRVVAAGSPEGAKFKPQTTRGQCFAAPSRIDLICDSSFSCQAAWRVDVQ
jgi:hypothetical protein